MNPEDAARLNLGEGSTARLSTRRGALEVLVEISDRMQPGHVSIPNGTGLGYPSNADDFEVTGPSPNELTSVAPDFADMENVVRVINVPNMSGGRLMHVVMDAEADRALAFLAPPK